MLAILNKTIGPNFKAGDVIRGENSRIKKLRNQDLVTMDHSLIGMSGSIITFILCGLFAFLVVVSMFPHEVNLGDHTIFSWPWKISLLLLLFFTVWKAITQFNNGLNPYSSYFLSFITNIFGGVFIMAGHETSSSRYQDKTVSSTAAVSLYTIGALCIAVFLVSTIMWNTGKFGDNITTAHIILWILWWILVIIGYIVGLYFDRDYKQRRQRFIAFLKKKNATIEYKTKAAAAMRAYKNTGNADMFVDRNLELITESLNIDRQQVEDQKNQKKKSKKYRKN